MTRTWLSVHFCGASSCEMLVLAFLDRFVGLYVVPEQALSKIDMNQTTREHSSELDSTIISLNLVHESNELNSG
ncbi:hypothetical protein MTR_1g040115 [Medicago truncatula]|uniref:Uncharacterized protein n=1 Tax=Medicago truncatula TaxID=3880 RepID=A0A072VH81_MEDTR|nr:hypothetical protein MTR_1g040115 [Medicago truncatula]